MRTALITFLVLWMAVAPCPAATVFVLVRDVTSNPVVNRSVTVTLTSPTGANVVGPWVVAGDNVGLRTDNTGTAWFSNVLSLGEYRMDVAGNPGRSFPFSVVSTSGVYNVVQLLGTNVAVEMFYDTSQIDQMFGVAAGSASPLVKTNDARPLSFSNNLTLSSNVFALYNVYAGGLTASNTTGSSSSTMAVSGNTSVGGFADTLTSDPSAFKVIPGGGRSVWLSKLLITGTGPTAAVLDGSGVTNILPGNVKDFGTNWVQTFNGVGSNSTFWAYTANVALNASSGSPLWLGTPGGVLYLPNGFIANAVTLTNGAGNGTITLTPSTGTIVASNFNVLSGGQITGNAAGATNIPPGAITGTNWVGVNNGFSTNQTTYTNTANYPVLTTPTISGTYQNTAGNNVGGGPVLRQNGAAYSGIYSEQWGGSASAMADLPARGPDMHDNERRPTVVITTHRCDASVDGFKSCTIGNITNGVNAMVTNGFVAAITNFGIRFAFMVENGWCTNYRSSAGYLCWNSNRFGTMVDAGNQNGVCATNFTTYLRTNGFESWVIMYANAYVPQVSHWPSGSYSTLFANAPGNTLWDGSGANPFGANEYSIVQTPDSIHRDISSLYANGVTGLWLQDMTQGNGAGYFDQIARIASGASMTPYYINPGFGGTINMDNMWQNWYGGNADIRTNVPHGMVVGMFMGNLGHPWATRFANDVNGLYTETGEGGTVPSGSKGVGWIMGQVKYESRFLTNRTGEALYCFPTFGTDGFDGDNYTYKDWYAYFAANAFFNGRIWLQGDSTQWFYATNANFGPNFTNRGFLSCNQDVPLRAPTCVSLTTSNSIWVRDLVDGSKLLLMENSDANNTTNLTVTWNQLGIPSNVVANVVDVNTNAYVGFYTNSFTWTVPTISAALFKVKVAGLVDSATNYLTAVYDTANDAVAFSSFGGRRFLTIYRPHGEVGIGTNSPAIINVGSALTVQSPAGGTTLGLYDANNNLYTISRDSGVGLMQLTSQNAQVAVGWGITGPQGEFARFYGGGVCMATNALSSWPTAAVSRGGYAVVNSNSTVYILQSGPNSTAWTSTNMLGLTIQHIVGKSYALLPQNTTMFSAPQGNAVTNITTSDTDMQTRQAMGTGFLIVGAWVKASQAAGAGQSYTLTVMTNGVATGIAPSISGASATTAGQTFSSTPVANVQGDSIGVRIVSSATAATNTRFDWDVLYINQ